MSFAFVVRNSNTYIPSDVNLKFNKAPAIGDRIGIKINMIEKKIWLYLNRKFVTLLWQNIPNCIIPAISEGGWGNNSGCFTVTKVPHFE